MPWPPRRRAALRAWLAGALCAAAALVATARAAGGVDDARPTLYVFLQLDAKSSMLEQTLQKQLPDVVLTVFGRFRDYADGVKERHPDAVLAIPQVLELDHLKRVLQGVRGGKDAEPYAVITVGADAGRGSLSGKTVGIVDFLGQERTQAFATVALGASDIKTKRVAKIDDLLPLLEFSAADAVLLPSSAVQRFRERTRLTFEARELPNAKVGLPAVATPNEQSRAVVLRALQKLDAPAKALLGIDGWSVR